MTIERCPHCGSEKGYYTKDYVYGYSRFYCNFDGSEHDNSALYGGTNCKRGGIAYCETCQKKIAKIEEIEREIQNDD